MDEDKTFENEVKRDNVNEPTNYLHSKTETIDVICDCMTNDEFHG